MEQKPIAELLEDLRVKHPQDYESICNWIRTLTSLDQPVISTDSNDTTEHPVDPPNPPA